jgi:hypothetical protein
LKNRQHKRHHKARNWRLLCCRQCIAMRRLRDGDHVMWEVFVIDGDAVCVIARLAHTASTPQARCCCAATGAIAAAAAASAQLSARHTDYRWKVRGLGTPPHLWFVMLYPWQSRPDGSRRLLLLHPALAHYATRTPMGTEMLAPLPTLRRSPPMLLEDNAPRAVVAVPLQQRRRRWRHRRKNRFTPLTVPPHLPDESAAAATQRRPPRPSRTRRHYRHRW